MSQLRFRKASAYIPRKKISAELDEKWLSGSHDELWEWQHLLGNIWFFSFLQTQIWPIISRFPIYHWTTNGLVIPKVPIFARRTLSAQILLMLMVIQYQHSVLIIQNLIRKTSNDSHKFFWHICLKNLSAAIYLPVSICLRLLTQVLLDRADKF